MPTVSKQIVNGIEYEIRDAAAREGIAQISADSSEIKKKNAYNIIRDGIGHYVTKSGIEYEQDGDIVTASGTATANSYWGFVASSDSLLGLSKNVPYYADFAASDSNIVLDLRYYVSGGSTVALNVQNGRFIIPDDAVGILFRTRIASGVTVDNDTFSLSISAYTNAELTALAENVLKNGLYNMVLLWHEHTRVTGSGVTYTPLADGTLLVNGTTQSSQTGYYYFALNNSDLLGVVPGNVYSVKYSTTDNNIGYELYVYYDDSGDKKTRKLSLTDGKYVTIPDDACGLFFRLVIPKSTAIYNAIVDFRFYSMPLPNHLHDSLAEMAVDSLLPKYWNTYLTGKLPELFTADREVGYSGFSFAFFTDLHWLYNEKNAPAVLRWIRSHTAIRTIIQGGDILANYTSREMDPDKAYIEYVGLTKDLDVINVFGNHDLDTNSTTSEIYTKADFYAICQRTTEHMVNWEPGTLCGYMDNPVQKVRMIFWDYSENSDYSLMQGWITELESDWSVLVFTHFIWHSMDDENPHQTYGQPMIDAVDAVYDTAGCTIIGIVCGHLHSDRSMTSAKGYPIIATTCDASTGGQASHDPVNPTRIPGTTTEQAIDLYYVDTENRTIKTVRIGAGDTVSNRSFSY